MVTRTPRKLSLGFDSSTTGLKAVIIDMETGETVYQHKVEYKTDKRLQKFVKSDDGKEPYFRSALGLIEQTPQLFNASIDAMFEDMKFEGNFEMKDIKVINDSGQQHGQVLLSALAQSLFNKLKYEDSAESDLNTILEGVYAYDGTPIWKTGDTTEEAAYLRDAAGGKEPMIKLTGSDSPERFSATPWMRIGRRKPEILERIVTSQLISSYIPALLTGETRVPWDFGNGAGTSVMNYRRKVLSKRMVRAVAKYCGVSEAKIRGMIPGLTAPNSIVGKVNKYFAKKYGLSEECMVAAGSGDNPQTKVLTGDDVLTLGGSGVYIKRTDGKEFDLTGRANSMYDGLGRGLIFRCRTNCQNGLDKIRAKYKLGELEFDPAYEAIEDVPFGNVVYIWHPGEDDETLPRSPKTDKPYIVAEDWKATLGTEYAAYLDTMLAAIKLFSGKDKDPKATLVMCGGASGREEVKRRASAIWGGRPVYSAGIGGAASGAAVAGADAYHKEMGVDFDPDELSAKVLPLSDEPVIATPQQIAAYHAPGAFLTKLEKAYEHVGAR